MFTRITHLTYLLAPVAFVSIAGAAAVPFPASAAGGNNHTYEVVLSTTLERNDAQVAAITAGGYLVTITSPAEQDFVESLLSDSGAPTGSYWMGMEIVGEDQYRWLTGEVFAYENFADGEPNDFLTSENAGQVYWTSDADHDVSGRRGEWNDTPFTGYADGDIADLVRAGFILERNPLDGSGGEPPPVAIPLPPAVFAAPLTMAATGLVMRRRRRLA